MNVDFVLYTPTSSYSGRESHDIQLLNEYREHKPLLRQWEELKVSSPQICKMTFLKRNLPSQLVELEKTIREKINGGLNFHRSVPRMLEITTSQASKASAMKRLMQDLNIISSNTVAIGDGYNDIDLFKAVGISIAMDNSPDQVKKEATLVIGTNDDDGVAKFLSESFFAR